MIRRVVAVLASPRLATVLIAFVGVWAGLGSFVPQGDASAPAVASWASAYPALEPVVRALGLHQAFTAPVFLAGVAVLALSTAVCAWQRTRVALRRARTLRAVSGDPQEWIASAHDVVIDGVAGQTRDEVLTAAAGVLARLGIPTRRDHQRLVAVSPSWSVWGSAVFHWALVGLIVVLPLSALVRSSGQIGLAVGQTAPDAPASYGTLSAGPLHSWKRVDRSVRVDAFDLRYQARGIDRGPTPTVSVLDGEGDVLVSQPVYPNHTLKLGSLTIYPADYGLAATIALLDGSGAEVQRLTQLLDFSSAAEGGTAPVTPVVARDADGQVQYRMYVSVPLDRTEGGYLGRIPERPTARVVVQQADDASVVDTTVAMGEAIELPMGGGLRLVDVDYYARLQLVDDPSTPVLYAIAVAAMLGLGVATMARQIALVAEADYGPAGARLTLRMRLWRILSTSRSEIEDELRRSLRAEEGSRS